MFRNQGKYILNSVIVFIWYMIISSIIHDHVYILPITILGVFLHSFIKSNEIISFKLILSHIALLEIIFLIILFQQGTSKPVVIAYCIYLPVASLLGNVAKLKKVTIPIFVIFMAFTCIYILPNWFSFYKNYNSHRNKDFPNIEFTTKDSKAVDLEDGIVVLDFWVSSCGVCFQQFPEFEKLKNEYSSYPQIRFYSVNVPIERDEKKEVLEKIKRLNYDFETIFAKNRNEVKDSLKINSFPRYLVLKDGKIRYKGELIVNDNVVINNMRDILYSLNK